MDLGMKKIKDIIYRDTKIQATKYDTEIALDMFSVSRIKKGEKTHIMRFYQIDGKDAISLPAYRRMPLFEGSKDNPEVGKLDVDSVMVKQWKNVNERDAKAEGPMVLSALKETTACDAVKHGFMLTSENYVSFYHIEKVIWAE